MATEPPSWLIGTLIATIAALAGVIAFLWKHYTAKLDAIGMARDLERLEWAKERAQNDNYKDKLRAEFEERHRGVLQQQQQQIKETYDVTRAHVDQLRAEFMQNADVARREMAEHMEAIATKAADASDRIVVVLDKFYDRLLGPRRSRPG